MSNMKYVAKIDRTLREVERFKEAALDAAQVLVGGESTIYLTGSKETAAMRRASLDLTRALAKLREPN